MKHLATPEMPKKDLGQNPSTHERYQLIMDREADRYEESLKTGGDFELAFFYSASPTQEDIQAISDRFKSMEK